ncbi:DUF4263 domain-containing protein [Candidatus Kaiserbacteria bacterium]|nr:DUF4263 domain-containing protein [Candidatus Kaiserbacteria bacterium]
MNTENKLSDKILKDNLPVYFLGICDRYSTPSIGTADGGGKFTRQDMIGLRTITSEVIFPLPADNYYIVLQIDNYRVQEVVKEKIMLKQSSNGHEVGFIEISSFEIVGGGSKFPTKYTISVAKIPGIFREPGEYDLFFREDRIGSFFISHSKALPLTPARLQAIKSDPLSAKHVKYELRCNECKEVLQIQAGIDKDDIAEGVIWYEDLPTEFKCKCGKLHIPLHYLKENMHYLLGYKPSPFTNSESMERNYTHAKLEEIYRGFKELIENEETTEEQIQKYIEENPFILNPFNPRLLKFKADATTKHKTDFAIYNHRNELVLIEIERANLQLFTKDNSQHSQLTHAINQVEDWLLESQRNRYGFLNDLKMDGVSIDDVTSIKGVVIAGRTKKIYQDQLEKLYARGGYLFMTYDDLLKHLFETVQKLKNL